MRERIDVTGDQISLKDALHQISELIEQENSKQGLPNWQLTEQIDNIIANYLGWKTYRVTAWTNEDSEYCESVDPHGISSHRPDWSTNIAHAILLYSGSVPTKIYSNPLYIVLDALRERYLSLKD